MYLSNLFALRADSSISMQIHPKCGLQTYRVRLYLKSKRSRAIIITTTVIRMLRAIFIWPRQIARDAPVARRNLLCGRTAADGHWKGAQSRVQGVGVPAVSRAELRKRPSSSGSSAIMMVSCDLSVCFMSGVCVFGSCTYWGGDRTVHSHFIL